MQGQRSARGPAWPRQARCCSDVIFITSQSAGAFERRGVYLVRPGASCLMDLNGTVFGNGHPDLRNGFLSFSVPLDTPLLSVLKEIQDSKSKSNILKLDWLSCFCQNVLLYFLWE